MIGQNNSLLASQKDCSVMISTRNDLLIGYLRSGSNKRWTDTVTSNKCGAGRLF